MSSLITTVGGMQVFSYPVQLFVVQNITGVVVVGDMTSKQRQRVSWQLQVPRAAGSRSSLTHLLIRRYPAPTAVVILSTEARMYHD